MSPAQMPGPLRKMSRIILSVITTKKQLPVTATGTTVSTTGTTTPGIRQAGTVPRSVRGTALTTALFIPIMVPRFRSTITGVHPGMTRSIVRCTVMVPVPIGAVLPGMSDWAIRSAVCTARFQCARGDLPADTDGTIAGILAQPLS